MMGQPLTPEERAEQLLNALKNDAPRERERTQMRQDAFALLVYPDPKDSGSPYYVYGEEAARIRRARRDFDNGT